MPLKIDINIVESVNIWQPGFDFPFYARCYEYGHDFHPVFRGNRDGDFCAVEIKKMEVAHWSKKVHLGFPVSSIEFCPTER